MQSSAGRTLCGIFGGDADLEGGAAWLTDDDGERHEIWYPDGWEVHFEPDAVLVGPTGEPYARPGDRVCVWGSPVEDGASIGMVGPVFAAASVEGGYRPPAG